MLTLTLLACAEDPEGAALLEPSFGERLSDGYHCGLPWYVGHDAEQTLRLQAELLEPWWLATTSTTGVDDEVRVALGEEDGPGLYVFVGACLMVPGCTDDPGSPSGSCTERQEIAHGYHAISGTAALWWTDADTIAGRVTDLVLEGRRDEPLVEVDELALPAVRRWTE